MSPQASRFMECVVLAAGRSRRAGTFKPAFEVAGTALLRHAVDGARAWCRRVIVVTGFEHERAAQLVDGLDDVVTVHNPRYDQDMFLSVQTGAGALGADLDGFFVLPADCPLVEAAVYHALIESFNRHGHARAVVPEHAGRGGHPVLLPIAARGMIVSAAPPTTLRDVVAAHQPLRLAVASASVLVDADTPEDLARLRAAPPTI